MKNEVQSAKTDAYKLWAEWSPQPEKKSPKLTHIVSAIIIAASFVQVINLTAI